MAVEQCYSHKKHLFVHWELLFVFMIFQINAQNYSLYSFKTINIYPSVISMGGQNQPVSTQVKTQNHHQCPNSKHPRFIHADIINSKDQNLYFEVSHSISNFSTYTQWQRKLNELKKIGPHSLYLPIQCEYKQQGFCGSSGTLKFKFQYFAFLLDEEIINRHTQNQPFEENQLWFLLYILTQSASQLHKVNKLVGDIHPKNIFINHSGDISVYSMHSFPQDLTNFQKVLYFKESSYLPPEGVNDIQAGKQLPTYDEKIGQGFSVGLTIMNAILLTDFSFLYDKMESFNEIAFTKIIDTFKESQIDDKLKTIICALLQINPQKRLTCIELQQYLSPYQKQILQLEDFNIETQLPLRSKQQIDESQKSKGEIESLQTKVTDKLSVEDRRQGSKKTISLNGSPKKQASQRNVNAQLSQHSATKYKNQSIEQQNHSPQMQLPHIINQPSPFIIQHQDSIGDNYGLYNSQKRMITIQKKKEQQRFKIPRVTFKTGDLFQRQKSTTSVLLVQHSYPSNQNINFVQSRRIQHTPSQYQNNKESITFQYTEHKPSSNLMISSNDQYNDFLKSIEKQIEESKKMFPDSMR